ncbi:hypothetical protein CDAR_529491 [Caerostris darwini]|uniref:Uncharacterized protein n=1 Tax=Caerostris darwini TaxID=1538125 RepID=A0AAV4SD17_9ARAC|nr:hypothetical protein CDAR_529491 [Caerostris darwini]
MGPSSCYRAAGHASIWLEKGTKKKKEIALRGRKSTSSALLAQEMSSFWFRLVAKDNGRLALYPRELRLSLVGSYWSAEWTWKSKLSFYLKEFPSKNCCSQKGENSNTDKAEKRVSVTPKQMLQSHTSTWLEKGTKKKKEIALRSYKSTGDALLAQEMSSFWFRFGAKTHFRSTGTAPVVGEFLLVGVDLF